MRGFAFACSFLLLLFPFSACKSTGKGKLIVTIETPDTAKAEMFARISLEKMGIDDKDISVKNDHGQTIFEISQVSKYPADLKEKIVALFSFQSKVEFWETYKMPEVATGVNNYFSSKADTLSAGKNGAITRFLDVFSPDMKETAERSCSLGTSLPKDTAAVNRILDSMMVSGFMPPHLKFAWTPARVEQGKGTEPRCTLVLLKGNRDGKARMESPEVSEAHTNTTNNGHVEIAFTMSGYDADAWKRMTKDNIGNSVAIVVDGIVYSYPTVQSEIPNGNCQITGDFSTKQADEIVSILKSRPFPVPVRVVEIRAEQ